MAVHHVEAALLQVEVSIDVHDGVVANGDTRLGVGVLEVIHAEPRAVCRGIVGGEVAHVASQLDAQHLGIGEFQVQVAIDVHERQGQNVVAAAVLRRHLVVPVQDAEDKVLIQCGAQHLYVAAVLSGSDVVVELAASRCRLLAVAAEGQVGVVLDVLHAHREPCVQTVEREASPYVGAELLAEIVVPPEVLRVVVLEVERRVEVLHVAVEGQVHRVAQQAEVQVAGAFEVECPDVVAQHGHLARHIEVQHVAQCAPQVAPERERLLVPAADALLAAAVAQRVGQGERAELVHRIRRAPEGNPFVDALNQRQSGGVLHRQVARGIDGVVGQVVVGIVPRWVAVVDESPSVPLRVGRVERLHHGHELLSHHHRVGQAVGDRLVVAHVEVLLEEGGAHTVLVPVAFQVHGHVGRAVRLLARRHILRSGDVAVVRQSPALGPLQLVVVEQQVHAVALAAVVAVEGSVEERCRLVAVEPAPIHIVEVEAHSDASSRIHGKRPLDALLAVDFVARAVVAHVRVGRLRVHEAELVRLRHEVIHRLSKQVVVAERPVEEDARLARRPHVAQVVVLTVKAVGEVHVLEAVDGRVRLRGDDLAQRARQPPCPYLLRRLAVLHGAVAAALAAGGTYARWVEAVTCVQLPARVLRLR